MFGRKIPWWVFAGVAVLVVGSLGVTTTWSYIKTAWRGVGKTIREATPIAFDLERLNNELRDLEPEIRRNQMVVAQLEVDVENLQQQIAAMEAEQAKALAEMRKLREALGSGKATFQFAGREYRRDEVETDLARRLDRYEARQTELEAKKALLQERRRNLEAAVKKVNEYRRQYEQLKIKAESLAAQLKTLESARAAGSVGVDESRISRAKELAKEIETRIRVAQRMLESEQKVEGEIPIDADTRPVTERFDEMFGAPEKPSDSKNLGT